MSWTTAFAPEPGNDTMDAHARAADLTTAQAVRLTRRGRLLLVLLLAGLLLAAFSLGRADSSRAATAAAPGAPIVSTTVHPGETLWAVAQRVAPGVDPRDVVAQLRRLNHLESSSLLVGQQLVVPA